MQRGATLCVDKTCHNFSAYFNDRDARGEGGIYLFLFLRLFKRTYSLLGAQSTLDASVSDKPISKRSGLRSRIPHNDLQTIRPIHALISNVYDKKSAVDFGVVSIDVGSWA